jgi:cysteine-rich repeat protein
VWEGVEGCDDGNAVDTDECVSGCVPASCGDGFVGPGEACDDGNAVPDDGCDQCVAAGCGDGVPQDGEECDDGNLVDADECTNACNLNVCGDGIEGGPGEACDDGNMVEDDGCTSMCTAGVCGDGIVAGDAEECDHGAHNGNPDDGAACSTECKRFGWLVFVSDGQFRPGLDFDGVAEADDLCVAAAADGLGIAAPFRAWLSDEVEDAATRLSKSVLPFVTVTAMNQYEQVAGDWLDLTDGDLDGPIHVTELGAVLPNLALCNSNLRVWTGTAPDGGATPDNCNGWLSSSPAQQANVGSARATTAEWTLAPVCNDGCDGVGRLYCFEQP